MSEIDNDLLRVILILKHRALTKKSTGKYSWDAISSIMQKTTGIMFSYDNFVDAYENVPALANLVTDYDQNGLTVSTKADDSEPETNADPNAVKSAAKRAAKNIQDRP